MACGLRALKSALTLATLAYVESFEFRSKPISQKVPRKKLVLLFRFLRGLIFFGALFGLFGLSCSSSVSGSIVFLSREEIYILHHILTQESSADRQPHSQSATDI